MLKEFKAFILKGNVVDLSTGVIIGAAFGTIVKSLTDLSGGTFHLDSELDEGTVVTLRLPLCTDKEKRSAAE